MQHLRLLADDLTGALDTSAELVGALGPLEVTWTLASALRRQGSFAIDSGSRELTPEQAFAVTHELAPLLQGAAIAYKKIDSLLRGPLGGRAGGLPAHRLLGRLPRRAGFYPSGKAHSRRRAIRDGAGRKLARGR
jgi:Sugar-binding N-terminal domain